MGEKKFKKKKNKKNVEYGSKKLCRMEQCGKTMVKQLTDVHSY